MRAVSALVLLALAAAGCGEDDEGDAPAGGGQAAEAKVKDQLEAIADNRADAFCATLTPEYGRTFTRQIATATDTKLADWT